jgi:hypothetical protein
MPEEIRAGTNLSSILTGAARNSWIALNEDQSKVVGRGETLEQAVKEAQKNGVDDPIVVWAPRTWQPSVHSWVIQRGGC